MTQQTEILLAIRAVRKLYHTVCEPVRRQYGVTQPEIEVIAFLANTAGYDMASDIVQLRMLPKANVSQAVESLILKGWLIRRPDAHDRRRVHLALSDSAQPLAREIRQAREWFGQRLFSGLLPKEQEQYAALSRRILQNATGNTERNMEPCNRKTMTF